MARKPTTTAGVVAKRLAQRGKQANKVVVKGAQTVARDSVVILKADSPKRTGKLASSWREQPITLGALVLNSARYSGFVHDGQLARDAEAEVRERLAPILDAIAKRLRRGK